MKVYKIKKHLKSALLAGLALSLMLATGCASTDAGTGSSSVSKGSGASSASTASEKNYADTVTTTADSSTPLAVHCFDAGKADAFLLTCGDTAILIDTGEDGYGKKIVKYMEKNDIADIDYLIITHFDQDHVGGAAKVLSSVDVGTVLQSNSAKDSDEYESYLEALADCGLEAVTVSSETDIDAGGVHLTINPPAEDAYAVDASNNSSLIVSVAYGEQSMLFAGDAEDLRLSEYLSSHSDLHYDILKLPHHGVYQATYEALLESATPEYTIITCSKSDDADDETLDLIASEGSTAYLTRDGAIDITFDGTASTPAVVQE